MVDILNRELEVGDFVAYATSCTSHGKLRRGVITKINEKNISVKSFVISERYKWKSSSYKIYKTVTCAGTVRRGIDLIKLGSSLEDAFTEDEIKLIKSRKYIITNYKK